MEPALTVDAGSPVATGVLVEALVDVDGAELACEAAALAHGAVGALLADPAIPARVGVAELAVVTALTAKLGRALAVEVVFQVDALGIVQTRRGGTWIEVIFAVGSSESRRTTANVSSTLFLTSAQVLAGVRAACAWR